MAPHRIVVFTGAFDYTVRKGIVAIDDAIPELTWLVLLQRPARTLRQLLHNQAVNFRRNGWRWIPYQLADLWRRTTSQRSRRDSRSGPGSRYSERVAQERPNLRLLRVSDVHAPGSIAAVREFAPDLGLSLAAPILRRALFSLPRLGTINLHKGKLPEFRGMPPAFWEMWHDQASVGCSVHCVDDRLDTGDLVVESSVSRARHSTVRGLQLQLDEVGIDLMIAATRSLLDGSAARRPQPAGQGTTHRKPTLSQQASLRRRLSQAGSLATLPRHLVKEARAATLCGLYRGLRRVLAPRITVLLYHRISDDVRDNLTVGIEQFERQMAIVAERCHVLPIEEVLAASVIPKSPRPLVAVTFDDGYLDNYLHAAPILLRHDIPAAFFVATGIIDSDRRFPHDLRRGNPAIPTMRWEQLRTMHRWGFTIGSHTVNHIDCASEPEDVVREELHRSRDALRSELGIAEPILAYPYGGRLNMTPQRLQLVREAGYSGCLAAYGGTNLQRVDRFNVLRRGISHEFSDRAFRLECLGLL
jgi:peptidoglycan/xylan/chitin deacetylase (PgdA/CDA1 family)